jgi:hypothetical protein
VGRSIVAANRPPRSFLGAGIETAWIPSDARHAFGSTRLIPGPLAFGALWVIADTLPVLIEISYGWLVLEDGVGGKYL